MEEWKWIRFNASVVCFGTIPPLSGRRAITQTARAPQGRVFGEGRKSPSPRPRDNPRPRVRLITTGNDKHTGLYRAQPPPRADRNHRPRTLGPPHNREGSSPPPYPRHRPSQQDGMRRPSRGRGEGHSSLGCPPAPHPQNPNQLNTPQYPSHPNLQPMVWTEGLHRGRDSFL